MPRTMASHDSHVAERIAPENTRGGLSESNYGPERPIKGSGWTIASVRAPIGN